MQLGEDTADRVSCTITESLVSDLLIRSTCHNLISSFAIPQSHTSPVIFASAPVNLFSASGCHCISSSHPQTFSYWMDAWLELQVQRTVHWVVCK